MGNFFTNELQCDLCNKQNIEPLFFTKKYNNVDEILIDRIPPSNKFDKYGNKLDNSLNIKNSKYSCIFVCSNGHELPVK